MKEKLIDISLSVDIVEKEVFANLRFSNTNSKKVYLDQQTICYNNIIHGAYFQVEDERGEDVDYKGMLVSRDIDFGYFITLNPGDVFESKIKLNEVYELEKGKKYTIQYKAYHPSYLKEQDLTKIESNKIEIVY